MSRYTGPRLKLMRALGMELPGLGRKTLERKPNPPGQHGAQKRAKLSNFALQLREKQKLRFNYGVSERQLRRYVKMAFGSRKNPGHYLLQTLERRLDSVAFRCGYAPSIASARQLVSHGHIKVNGKKLDIPSYLVDVGDVVTVSDKAQKMPQVVSTLDAITLARPGWLGFETVAAGGKILTMPDRDSFPFPISEGLIVEYYTQRT